MCTQAVIWRLHLAYTLQTHDIQSLKGSTILKPIFEHLSP